MERFAQLMLALGRRPVVEIEPMDSSVPGPELAVGGEMTAHERLREAASWNLVASRLAVAGETARADGHPATRRSRR